MKPDDVRRSKHLALVLRHDPASVGVTLDAEGWIAIDVLLAAMAAHGTTMSRDDFDRVVATNPKRRFVVRDGTHVRAAQGHSIDVELGLEPIAPPETLFHGTVEKFLASIRERGLIRGERHHVHLSATREAAIEVAKRRGRPVLLEVRAAAMHADGHAFFRSENGVWLTLTVPPTFLRFPPA